MGSTKKVVPTQPVKPSKEKPTPKTDDRTADRKTNVKRFAR